MKLDLHILDSKTNARTAIIALHGWTGDQFVLEPVANMLKLGSVKWFFPRAPYFAPTPKKKGFTWFEGSDNKGWSCLLYTSPSPRDATLSRMPSSA